MGKTYRRQKNYFDDDYIPSYKNKKKKNKKLNYERKKDSYFDNEDKDNDERKDRSYYR